MPAPMERHKLTFRLADAISTRCTCWSYSAGLCGASGRCGLSQPGFETGRAESCVIARQQCSLADFRARVTCVRISDDFAGILERYQAPPHQFIHAKLFRPGNLDDAVYRLTYCNSGDAPCDIVGGHRLKKHGRQMNLVAHHGNVGKAFEELEELRRVDDGVGD